MTERSPRKLPADLAPGDARRDAPGQAFRWMRAEVAETDAEHAVVDREPEQPTRYDADDEARLLYLRNMGDIADERRRYWEDALGSISRRTTFVYLAGVVVFAVGVVLAFVGAWLISRDGSLVSAIPAVLGGLTEAALIPVTTIERGLAKDKAAAERALDKQSTIAHVSGIAAMTCPERREHILADLAGRLIATIDEP